MKNKIEKEIEKDEIELIEKYRKEWKLHPDFLPFTTYDLVQMGYPVPNYGAMVARAYSGTDFDGLLLPGGGMWVKAEEVNKLIVRANSVPLFVNYELSEDEIELVKHLEDRSGFELMYCEEAKDETSFLDVIERNIRWNEDHFEEKIRSVKHKIYQYKNKLSKCPECLVLVDREELLMFGGLCETCSEPGE